MANKDKFKKIIKSLTEWLLYMIAYTVVFLFVSSFFDSFIIAHEHLFVYSFIAVVLISILNKTIRPIIFKLTLPITGLTLGLFYFVNNMIILKLVEFIMNGKIVFTNLATLFFIAVLLSLFNVLIEYIIVKPFIKKVKTYEQGSD